MLRWGGGGEGRGGGGKTKEKHERRQMFCVRSRSVGDKDAAETDLGRGEREAFEKWPVKEKLVWREIDRWGRKGVTDSPPIQQ